MSGTRRPEFLVVAGPTASGKSQLAMDIARAISGSIVCCDSVQLYRGFDIGSAKPGLQERSEVPHYLFDVLNWSDPCDAAIYAQIARQSIETIKRAGGLPIIVGGTGLYLRALLGDAWDDDIPSDAKLRAELASRESEDLFTELKKCDPRRAADLHPNDRFRVIRALEINRLTGAPVRAKKPEATDKPQSHFLIFLDPNRDVLYTRINARTLQMLELGLVDEVKRLLAAGVDPSCKPMQSIGYKQVNAMLNGDITPDKLESTIAAATRQYAKRQVTWFKKVPCNLHLTGQDNLPSILQQLRTEFGR